MSSQSNAVGGKVTLDDAFAVRGIGALTADPTGRLGAMELGGEIIVFDTSTGEERARLKGHSPAWAPGRVRRLAFFAQGRNAKQIWVWEAARGTAKAVSREDEDLWPDTFANFHGTHAYALSWSPDARKLVLSTRRMGDYGAVLAKEGDRPKIKVFGPQAAVSPAVLEDVFKVQNYWAARGVDAEEASRRRASDRVPELALSRLLIVDIESGEAKVLGARPNSYLGPAWSPDGCHLAALVNTTEMTGATWMRGSSAIDRTALALIDPVSGVEEIVVPPVRILGQPVWAPDGRDIYFMVYRHRPTFDMARVLRYSLAMRQWTEIAMPREQAVKDLRFSRDGRSLSVVLENPFATALWTADLKSWRWRKVQTHGWVVNDYTESAAGVYLFNAQSPTFEGRLYRSEGARTRLLFDANPQIAALTLGEQRRLTWRNEAHDELDAIVILPPDYDPARRYPLIVDVYPNTPSDGFKLKPSAQEPGQLQAAWGYVVFRPGMRVPRANYWFPRGEEYTHKARGSVGIPILVDDVSSGIRQLADAGVVDARRVGIFGHSNGGWAANLLLAHSTLAKAAVVSNTINNAYLGAFFARGSIQTDGDDLYAYGNVFDDTGSFIEFSPILRMRNIASSVLLLMGDNDWPLAPQMLSQYQVLRSADRDVTLVRYTDQGHFFTDRAVVQDALERIHRFYDERLIGLTGVGRSRLE